MKNNTRVLFTKMCENIAKTYGIQDVTKLFAATPSIEQKLMDKIVESSAFLQKINIVPVDDLQGEKIFGSVTGIVGKRTNTKDKDRQTKGPLNLDSNGYKCEKTEYDVHINYAQLDAWARYPDLYKRFVEYTRKAIALARIRTGFYGLSAELETDSDANPNGEDLNIGWFQKLREFNEGTQVFDEGETEGEIRIGGEGDYANLDAFVHGVTELIDDKHREGGDLIAIVGRDLMSMDKSQLYTGQGATPTEKERIESAAITRTYGGLATYSIPFFPSRGLLVTSWNNLSIYYQKSAVRQKIEENAKRDRIEHYNTINESYVVEDEEKAAMVEFDSVKLWNGKAYI